MATFYQKNQVVGTQYSADVINLNQINAQNRDDFTRTLRLIRSEMSKCDEFKLLPPEKASSVSSSIEKAISNSESSQPAKKDILGHLENARSILNTVTGAGGLAELVSRGIQLTKSIFQ